MFTLKSSLDSKEKEEIYDHFVVTQEIMNKKDLQKFQGQMLYDFSNVQREEPYFVLSTLLPRIEKWNIRRFQMIPIDILKHKLKPKHRREEIKILQLICHIDFRQVTYINLYGLNINTIQPLALMNLQNLMYLHLKQNHITSLKPFAKASLKRLNDLHIDSNKYVYDEFKHFSKMNSRNIPLFTLPEEYQDQYTLKYNLYQINRNSAKQNLIEVTRLYYHQLFRKILFKKCYY